MVGGWAGGRMMVMLCDGSLSHAHTHTQHIAPHTHSHTPCLQAKFGISAVAQSSMELYTTAVLRASLRPPSPPKCEVSTTPFSMHQLLTARSTTSFQQDGDVVCPPHNHF